jgi:hypothetical protein
MTDLVKQLRTARESGDPWAAWDLALQAADRIEKLEAANLKQSCIEIDDQMRIEKLEAALRNVLLWADRCQQCDYDDDWAIIEGRARKALEGKDD